MERPIIFSKPMVQAILEGRKSQTRRIVKFKDFQKSTTKGYDWEFRDKKERWHSISNERLFELCPYGSLCDILWVRETWRIVGWRDGEPFVIEYKDGKHKRDVYLNESRAEDYNIECTDQCLAAGLKTDSDDNFIRPKEGYPTKWRPSIFMPKEACRIKLEVTNIRVEKLCDITEEDAMTEGISLPNYAEQAIKDVKYPAPSDIYAELWDEINGTGSWIKNPWVWVIEFKRI